MTPIQLQYLTRRWQEQEDRHYHRTGLLAAATVNFSMYPPRQPAQPTDFIPGYSRQEPELTDEELAAQINASLLPRSRVRRPD